MARRALLVCGVLSSLLYVAMNVFVPMQWEGYSTASQTVSELSAVGAPTRRLWVSLAIPYILLVTAFGFGVWKSAGRNRPLRMAGRLLIAYGVVGVFWPPMHLRGAEATLTDTLHIVFTMVTVLLMVLAIGFGAAAFGARFRRYSVGTLVILVAFGVMTGMDAPKVAADLPTPWIGVWERINIGVFILWVVVLAVLLLRAPRAGGPDGSQGQMLPAVSADADPVGPASLDNLEKRCMLPSRLARGEHPDVVRGTPHMLIRKTLALAPMHGYTLTAEGRARLKRETRDRELQTSAIARSLSAAPGEL